MAITIDPAVRRVWRSPDTVQFGIERPLLVLDAVSSADERMIAALEAGVTLDALRLVGSRAGAGPDDVDALLARLEPVLSSTTAAPQESGPLVIIDGEGPTAARIVALLREGGAEVRTGLSWSDPAVGEAAAAVIVASYAVEPIRHARWLRRDVPHLPVVFGDAGVTIGPFAHPGAGPCLRCVDLHRTDADPAWPAMAAQLHTLPRPGESELVVGAVASAAAGTVLTRFRGGRYDRASVSLRYDRASAQWSRRRWSPHPDCGCLALPIIMTGSGTRSRSGSVTAAAAKDDPTGSHAAPS